MKKQACFALCALALAACATKEVEAPATAANDPTWSMPGWSAQDEGRSTTPRSSTQAAPGGATGADAPRGATAETDEPWQGAKGSSASAQGASASARTDADVTGVNERDRDSSSRKTPIDQGNGKTDLGLTQRIRQAVIADDALSMNAKNVKIITAGGKVTLRGLVKSAEERAKIEAAARSIAGDANVVNEIEIEKDN